MARRAKNMEREKREDLYKAILKLQDLKQCMDFFEDVCSPNELQSMEQRFEVAKMLHEDKVYAEIMEKTKASTSTISRVKRVFSYGTGCLEEILDQMKENKQEK